VDIYGMLLREEERRRKEEERRRRERRAQMLKPLGVQDLFEEGGITIDMRKCWGIECNICVKICPTNALYWSAGKIGVTEELCLHCMACVLNCIVDDCIRVWRRRPDGTKEEFSKPRDVLMLAKSINVRKAVAATKGRFPGPDAYINRYGVIYRRWVRLPKPV